MRSENHDASTKPQGATPENMAWLDDVAESIPPDQITGYALPVLCDDGYNPDEARKIIEWWSTHEN